MPNKYSHSVVLAHYSSLGLIDLPNDQYIAYLKTYPSSKRASTTSRSKGYSARTDGSITSSTGYSGRQRILEDDAPYPRSIAGRKEQVGSTRRNVIIEFEEGSGDERVILHKKHEPVEPVPQSQKRPQSHELRTEKRKLPSVSTYTGRSSSEGSEGEKRTDIRRPTTSQSEDEPKTSPPSVINLNDYETIPVQQAPESASTQLAEPSAPSPAVLRINHISAQAIPVNQRTTSSSTQDTRVYQPNAQDEPDFDGFSDKHVSEVTITAYHNTEPKSSPAVPRSHFSKSTTSTQPVFSINNVSESLPKRMESATGFNKGLSNLKQPRRNRSDDSISSMNSDDMMRSTTAPPPVVPTKSEKASRSKPEKSSVLSKDPRITEDAIDPSFFDTLRGGPHSSATTPAKQRFTALNSHPPEESSRQSSRPSQQYSRHSSDHGSQNPDFWRGLEEMLSDSDASAVFPPDIAKYKPRDFNAAPPLKAGRIPRSAPEDGEMKRPTTAPAPKTTSRDAFASDQPLPDGRSRITVTKNGSLDKGQDAKQPTTVQLVDTSAQKKGKKGFLRKLRKKNYLEKTP